MFFGSRHNLIMPGDAREHGRRLGDEAAPRARPRLDDRPARRAAGTIERVEIDTRHFKGNAPGACSLEASTRPTPDAPAPTASWRELLPRTRCSRTSRHIFDDELAAIGDVTHVRLNIFPDGGVGRLRLFGRRDHRRRWTLRHDASLT